MNTADLLRFHAPWRFPPETQNLCSVMHLATKEVHAAHQWYAGLRPGRRLPAKSEIIHRAMTRFIRYLWMIERLEDDKYLVRLCSTGTRDLLGYDITGWTVDPGGRWAGWLPFYTHVLTQRSPSFLQNKIGKKDHPDLVTEVGLFPFADQRGQPRFILCPYGFLVDRQSRVSIH